MVELTLPDFDLPAAQLIVSAWHAKRGQRIIEGDRLIEISAGDVIIDLSAPASGILAEKCVKIDDQLTVGQLLARIEPA